MRLVLTCALVLAGRPARAEQPPVFPGRPELSRHTKEFGLETTAGLTEEGAALGAGLTTGAFVAPWLASFAGATLSPRWSAPRERWEARAGVRLVLPEPLFGGVFGYLAFGGGLLFTAADDVEDTYRRALTGIVGVGVFGNVTERVRLRFELRQHLRLAGESDSRGAGAAGLTLILLSR